MTARQPDKQVSTEFEDPRVAASRTVVALGGSFENIRVIEHGRYLFHAGAPCAALYLVDTGSFALSNLSPSGDEQVVGFCLPGELLGAECIGASHYSCSAAAIERATVRRLSLSALQSRCARAPELSSTLLKLLAHCIADLHRHMALLCQKTALQRLASFLIDMQLRVGQSAVPMPRGAVGSYLSMAPETVSRLLHQLERDGLVRLRGRRTLITDLSGLQAIVEREASPTLPLPGVGAAVAVRVS